MEFCFDKYYAYRMIIFYLSIDASQISCYNKINTSI